MSGEVAGFGDVSGFRLAHICISSGTFYLKSLGCLQLLQTAESLTTVAETGR